MSSGTPGRPNPDAYRQRSLWDASRQEATRWYVPPWEPAQWEPLPVEVAPRLPAWRRGLRLLLGVRVLVLGFLASATILGAGHVRGLRGDEALAEWQASRAVQVSAEETGPGPAGDPAAAPVSVPATPTPSPSPTATRLATATRTTAATRAVTAMAVPSATPTATATPSPTEDTSLVVVAPSATAQAGAQPAPTVVYPIGPPPVRLVIPSIGVDIAVVTVGTVKQTAGGQTYEVWDTAANAGAYHKMSAPPGYVGNTVINGHRDIHGKVFADLDKVRLGDPITVYTEDHEFVYTVAEILEVPEKYASAEQRAENQRLIGYIPEERLTLITCTPYGTNLNRLLIIARPAGQAGG